MTVEMGKEDTLTDMYKFKMSWVLSVGTDITKYLCRSASPLCKQCVKMIRVFCQTLMSAQINADLTIIVTQSISMHLTI